MSESSQLQSAMHFIIATVAKIFSALIVIKLLAWYVGPMGFGLLTQLMGLVAIVSMIAGGGITNGVIKVLSVHQIETHEGRRWYANALAITLFSCCIVALALVGGATIISGSLLQGQFYGAVLILAVAQFLIGIGSLLLAEASSKGNSRKYALVNVLGTVSGASLVVLGAYCSGLNGAGFASVLAPAMLGVFGLALIAKNSVYFVRPEVEWARVRHLLSFSSLTLVGALSVPLAQMFMREVMASEFSWEVVGLWQGVARISDVYMQFVGVTLINYALPRISKGEGAGAFGEFKLILAWLLGFLIICLGALWLVRDIVISLVFSEAFLPMEKFFPFQITGDIFRTIAAAFSYFLLARGQLRVPLLFEFSQGVLLIIIFQFIVGGAGEMAPVFAHAATYFALSMLMAWRVKCFLRGR